MCQYEVMSNAVLFGNSLCTKDGHWDAQIHGITTQPPATYRNDHLTPIDVHLSRAAPQSDQTVTGTIGSK